MCLYFFYYYDDDDTRSIYAIYVNEKSCREANAHLLKQGYTIGPVECIHTVEDL